MLIYRKTANDGEERAMKTAKTLRRKGPFRRYISSIYILYPPVYKHTKKDQNAAGRTVQYCGTVQYVCTTYIVLRTERSPVARISRGATKIVGARVSLVWRAWLGKLFLVHKCTP